MPTTYALLGKPTVMSRQSVSNPDGTTSTKLVEAENEITFVTKIAKENAGSLQMDKQGKFAKLLLNPASVNVKRFSDYSHIREVAGDRYESVIVEICNAAAIENASTQARNEIKKWTLVPTNIVTAVQNLFSAFELTSLFSTATSRAAKESKKVITERMLSVDINAMSDDELRAHFAKVRAQLLGK